MPKRALLIVLDSVGIGHAPDAAEFGDDGANTVGHIRERVTGFSVPQLDACGLGVAEALAADRKLISADPIWSVGCLVEKSAGKDTTTGHWEIAGAPLPEAFATFTSFPETLVAELEEVSGVSFLGNYAQSGTVILEELGDEHVATGNPILYTSADSVLQIAAHEEVIPIERLYQICEACRVIADRERIGRVIARPFQGSSGQYERTRNRHDFSMQPPETVLNRLTADEVDVVGVGKISDIYAGSGITESHPTGSNAEGCEAMDALLAKGRENDHLIFTNLVDFDMLYGHRRNPEGYAGALEEFDQWLETLLPKIDDDMLVMITADHGNDPTWRGTDHTREKVPLLMRAPGDPRILGERSPFSDIAATLADWFETDYNGLSGESFL